jgi:osmotically-inducible protein OsmY
VTLRGPVKTGVEKQRIAELANTAGAKTVDNQIEIAPAS